MKRPKSTAFSLLQTCYYSTAESYDLENQHLLNANSANSFIVATLEFSIKFLIKSNTSNDDNTWQQLNRKNEYLGK